MLLLAAPLLSRLYTPEDFGLLAIYASILTLFSVVASMRYELAIPLPEDDQTAVNIVFLCLLIVLGVTVLSSLMVICWGDEIAIVLGVPVLASYFWLLPLGVLLIGTYQVFNFWAIRTKEFGTIAKVKIFQSATTVGVQILGFNLGAVSLLLGQVFGQGLGSTALGKSALGKPELRKVTWQGMKAAADRYKEFPQFSTWAGFLNAAGSQIPPLLFAGLFGVASAGLYSLANRVIAMPMTVLGQAVSNVFLSEAAERFRQNTLVELLRTIHRKLVLLIVGPVLILILFGSEVFGFVFGAQWEVAGTISSWLSLWIFFSFTTSPLSSVYEVLERQHLGMWMQFQLFLFRVVGILVGAYVGDFMTAVALFSISNMLSYMIYLIVLFRIAGGNAFVVFKNYALPAFAVFAAVMIKFGVLL